MKQHPVHQFRLLRDMSMKDFARRMGFSRVWCSYVEYGHKRPSRAFLRDAARVLRLAWPDALLMSSGAFFTFGAKAGHLDSLPTFFRVAYVLEAFLGVSLVALFISTWANRWFRER